MSYVIRNELTGISLAKEIVRKLSRSCSFIEFKGMEIEFNGISIQTICERSKG